MDSLATATPDLPDIPVVDCGRGGPPVLLAAERGRAEALLASGRGAYPDPVVRLFDRVSARWLARSGTPYLDEIQGFAETLGEPGVVFLNASYEWSCTSGVAPAPDGGGNRLIRVLDWPVDGLGHHLVAARHETPAGPWIDLTWPGFAGTVHGLAPGRFAAALHQAPMTRPVGVPVLDWAVNRWRLWRRPASPPAHLLRRVFETCAGFAEARRMLSETPVALPAIFLLSGPRQEEGCVIERTEDRAAIIESPATAANHWQATPRRGHARGEDSAARARLLAACQASAGDDLAWLVPPLLNETTRAVLLAEAATGRLAVRGYEADGPATRTLRLGAAAEAPAKALTGGAAPL